MEKKNTALRFNKNKIDPTYCSASLIYAVSAVMMKNSQKYGGKYPDNNWRGGMAASKWLPSAFRHVLALSEGEWLDPESGLPHLWHLAASVAIGVESSVKDDANFDKENFSATMAIFKDKYAKEIEELFSGVMVDEQIGLGKGTGELQKTEQDSNKKDS